MISAWPMEKSKSWNHRFALVIRNHFTKKFKQLPFGKFLIRCNCAWKTYLLTLWERPLFTCVLWVLLFKYLYSGAFEIHLWRILGIFMFGSNRPIFLISSKSLFSKYVSSCTICKALSYENWRPVIIVRVKF